jgi:hypothetical protein
MTDNTVDVRSRLMNDAQEMTWYGPHGAVLKRLRPSSNDVRARGNDRHRADDRSPDRNILGPTDNARSSLRRARLLLGRVRSHETETSPTWKAVPSSGVDSHGIDNRTIEALGIGRPLVSRPS